MILFVKDIFLQGRGLPEDDGGHAHKVRAHEKEARLHQGKAQAQKSEFFLVFSLFSTFHCPFF